MPDRFTCSVRFGGGIPPGYQWTQVGDAAGNWLLVPIGNPVQQEFLTYVLNALNNQDAIVKRNAQMVKALSGDSK